MAVNADGVVFRLGGEQLALAVGRPGAELLAGRRVLGGGFELVGVCYGGDQKFAMVQLDDRGQIQRVHLNDRLGSGRIVGISNDGIVLDVNGTRRTVLVGAKLAGEA